MIAFGNKENTPPRVTVLFFSSITGASPRELSDRRKVQVGFSDISRVGIESSTKNGLNSMQFSPVKRRSITRIDGSVLKKKQLGCPKKYASCANVVERKKTATDRTSHTAVPMGA